MNTVYTVVYVYPLSGAVLLQYADTFVKFVYSTVMLILMYMLTITAE